MNHWLLALIIFLAEMSVVTIGTIRIIFVSRGKKYLAPLLGCLEITIWLFAISQIMLHLNSILCFAAFAGGFTLGNFLGIVIEQRLAIGTLVVRVVTRGAEQLIEALRAAQFGVTSVPAEGASGPMCIIFTAIKRKDLPLVISIIQEHNPRAFYSVDELLTASDGVFPSEGLAASRWLAGLGFAAHAWKRCQRLVSF